MFPKLHMFPHGVNSLDFTKTRDFFLDFEWRIHSAPVLNFLHVPGFFPDFDWFHWSLVFSPIFPSCPLDFPWIFPKLSPMSLTNFHWFKSQICMMASSTPNFCGHFFVLEGPVWQKMPTSMFYLSKCPYCTTLPYFTQVQNQYNQLWFVPMAHEHISSYTKEKQEEVPWLGKEGKANLLSTWDCYLSSCCERAPPWNSFLLWTLMHQSSS